MPDKFDEFLGGGEKQAAKPKPPPSSNVGANVDKFLKEAEEARPTPSIRDDPLGFIARQAPRAKEFGTGFAQGAGENIASFPYPGRQFLGATLGRTEPGKAVSEFINQPWSGQSLSQISGRVAGLAAPYRGALGPAAVGAAKLGGNVGAWELAHYLMHASGIPGGYHAAWALYHTFIKFPHVAKAVWETIRGGGKAMEKGGEEALKGAKGAGTFIPKTVEGGKGAKAAKTQSKFTEAAKPTAKETAASSQKTARNILQRTSKKGDISSGDIAAAKLAKMTGAIHPGEEEVVEEFARMPVKR